MDYGNYSDENTNTKLSTTTYPSPANLEEFLPWACKQWQLPFTPVVKRVEIQGFCTSATPKARKGQKYKEDVDTDSDARSTALSDLNNGEVGPGVVNIYSVYDTNKNLQQLKFIKNCKIPNVLIKLISLAVPFHPYLNGIYIDSGLNQGGIYQLTKILSLSKVTEVTLDNTFLMQGNYYLLLDENTHVKYMSLARCKINDAVLENIALRLPDNQDLCVLNLASNRITDKGAEYLGNILKYNRKLSYLNLSDNTITDIGVISILNSLQEFPLTTKDITSKRCRYMNYLKKKDVMVKKIINDMRNEEFEKQLSARRKMRKSIAPPPLKKGKPLESTPQFSEPIIDQGWYDKAETFAIASLGTFTDAFSSDNTVIKEDVVYCLGNNTLACINLAYNNLSYMSVKKILDVLRTQDRYNRSPKGLLKICIDGNNIPESCLELSEIDAIIGSAAMSSQKAGSASKKKQPISRMSTKSGIL